MNTENQSLQTLNGDILSSVVLNGDLSKLTPDQKVSFYKQFCERLNLDPLSQPFKILKLNGKETLYCDRSGTAQINRVHKISHEIKARETVNGCYVVTAQAYDQNNRRTESIGAVPIDNLKGESLCNAMMKAETKAKRRATLDLVGLGILDETETETIPGAEIMDIPHENELPALTSNDPKWEGIVKALISGKRTMAQLKEKYAVSEEVETMLIDLINTPA